MPELISATTLPVGRFELEEFELLEEVAVTGVKYRLGTFVIENHVELEGDKEVELESDKLYAVKLSRDLKKIPVKGERARQYNEIHRQINSIVKKRDFAHMPQYLGYGAIEGEPSEDFQSMVTFPTATTLNHHYSKLFESQDLKPPFIFTPVRTIGSGVERNFFANLLVSKAIPVPIPDTSSVSGLRNHYGHHLMGAARIDQPTISLFEENASRIIKDNDIESRDELMQVEAERYKTDDNDVYSLISLFTKLTWTLNRMGLNEGRVNFDVNTVSERVNYLLRDRILFPRARASEIRKRVDRIVPKLMEHIVTLEELSDPLVQSSLLNNLYV
ncbi:MAG TPA: hypothetical protein VLF63_00500 [Patescibacteria group bacterium]|nr:hypothetical protein [Patescibacteria group bacterium]